MSPFGGLPVLRSRGILVNVVYIHVCECDASLQYIRKSNINDAYSVLWIDIVWICKVVE